MAPTTLAKARRKRIFLTILAVTVVVFVVALILKALDDGSSPLLTITYQVLGGAAGLGVGYILVLAPLIELQERKKERRDHEIPS